MFKNPNNNQEESRPEISNSGSSSNSSTSNNSETINKNQILINSLSQLDEKFVEDNENNPSRLSTKIDRWLIKYKNEMDKKRTLSLVEFNRCFRNKQNSFDKTKRNYVNLNSDFKNWFDNPDLYSNSLLQDKTLEYLYYFFIFEFLLSADDNVFFFIMKYIFRKDMNLTLFESFLPNSNFQFLAYKEGKINLIETYDKIIKNFIQNYDSNINYNASKRIVIDTCVSND